MEFEMEYTINDNITIVQEYVFPNTIAPIGYGINPKYEDAYLYSGLVYFFDDELGWAFEEFDKLLQINPKNKYALQMQAYIYFHFHDYKNETKVKKEHPIYVFFHISAPPLDHSIR